MELCICWRVIMLYFIICSSEEWNSLFTREASEGYCLCPLHCTTAYDYKAGLESGGTSCPTPSISFELLLEDIKRMGDLARSREFSVPLIQTNILPFSSTLWDDSSWRFRGISSVSQDTGTVLHPPVLLTRKSLAIHVDFYHPICKSRGWSLREDCLAGLTSCYLRYLAFRSHLPHHRERQPVSHGIETA